MNPTPKNLTPPAIRPSAEIQTPPFAKDLSSSEPPAHGFQPSPPPALPAPPTA